MTANQINFRKAVETERSNRENERIKEMSAQADISKAESARISADASRLSAEAADLKAQADAYNAKFGKSWIGDLQRAGANVGSSIYSLNTGTSSSGTSRVRKLGSNKDEEVIL